MACVAETLDGPVESAPAVRNLTDGSELENARGVQIGVFAGVGDSQSLLLPPRFPPGIVPGAPLLAEPPPLLRSVLRRVDPSIMVDRPDF